ncbi:MAG: dimethylarginine dimethylaminohydrolase family protein [Candidatus Kariarchaeaceae archaeon]|jgi:dimethylargininase
MKYQRAIVREISPEYKRCVSDFPEHHLINLDKAKDQHNQYIDLLKEIGLEVIKLEGDPKYPDCCFVEDNAVIHRNKALINRMGIVSRRGEVSVIKDILSQFKEIELLIEPATLEGGDIIHIDDNLLISGKTQRTNHAGINQLAKTLDTKVQIIEDSSIVHLKSYVTYLGDNAMLTTEKYKDHPVLQPYVKLVVPKGEEYAANTLRINDTIIIPSNYNQTKDLLKTNGFIVETLDMSEFQKCEGALTCLSLLF